MCFSPCFLLRSTSVDVYMLGSMFYHVYVLSFHMFTCVYMDMLAYIHLYTLAYMSMCESCLLVCRPCFYTMKLWTPDLNLHMSHADTTFCLLSCLFAFLLVFLLSGFFAFHAYHAYLFYAFPYAPCTYSFYYLSTGFLSLPLPVHPWNEEVWS